MYSPPHSAAHIFALKPMKPPEWATKFREALPDSMTSGDSFGTFRPQYLQVLVPFTNMAKYLKIRNGSCLILECCPLLRQWRPQWYSKNQLGWGLFRLPMSPRAGRPHYLPCWQVRGGVQTVTSCLCLRISCGWWQLYRILIIMEEIKLFNH